MTLYKKETDGETNFFDIFSKVLQEDTFTQFIFILCLNVVL